MMERAGRSSDGSLAELWPRLFVWGGLILLPLAVLIAGNAVENGWRTTAELVLSGMAVGGLYAVFALALVLMYQSTGVVNFGQGEIATFTTFIAWAMLAHLDLWAVFPLTLLAAFALGALLERIVMRPVEGAPPTNGVIVTLGLFVVFNSFDLWRFQSVPKTFPSAFGSGALTLGGIAISRHNLGTLLFSLGLVLFLYLFFQRSKLGLAIRATVDNRFAAQLQGIPVMRMLTMGWALAAAAGAVAGLLVAPVLFLEPNMMFSVLLFAFAAAVLGGLDNAPGAVVGGYLVGVIQTLGGAWSPVGPDVRIVLAFAMIVGVLLVRPQGLFGRQVARRV